MYVSEAVVEGTFLRDNVQSASNYHKIYPEWLLYHPRGVYFVMIIYWLCIIPLITLLLTKKINKEIWNIDLNSFDYVSLLWETSTL